MTPANPVLRYVVDIDGVLCQNGDPEGYADAKPIMSQIYRLRRLHAAGHSIVLHTARLASDRQTTFNWLSENGVPYDDLVTGKPPADVYVDDKAESWLPEGGAVLNRKPLVICYSGGMDSVVAYHWALHQGYTPDDILLLNFNIGNNYADKEAVARQEIGLPYTTIDLPIVGDHLGNQTTKDNYIIPGRNLIFATIAAAYGERVWIVGVKFEDHPKMFDKNSQFYRTASLACSQALGSPTYVESPFVGQTKTQMIEFMRDQGLSHLLTPTVSCYHDTAKRCGDCGLCFKRALAMEAAGCSERAEYDVDPFTSDTSKGFVDGYLRAVANQDFSHYCLERITETFDVLTGLGIELNKIPVLTEVVEDGQ